MEGRKARAQAIVKGIYSVIILRHLLSGQLIISTAGAVKGSRIGASGNFSRTALQLALGCSSRILQATMRIIWMPELAQF